MTRTDAEAQIADMLDIASGNSDKVYYALITAQRESRQRHGYSDAADEAYALLRLALADITGNAAYRH